MTSLQVLLHQDKKGPKKSEFELYWQKIERAEKAYATAERKRAAIVARFNDELKPLELNLAQRHFQLLEQLLGHLSKKSLGLENRQELIGWIGREHRALSESPFSGDLPLDRIMEQVHQHEMAMIKRDPLQESQMKAGIQAEIEQLFDAHGMDVCGADMDELLEAFEQSPQAFFKVFMTYAAEHAGQQADIEDENWDEQFDSQSADPDMNQSKRPEVEDDQPLQETLNTQQLTLLFKRLAQKLHPDRASNDADRALRHDLMLRLNRARKENDVYTLLQLVRDYGDTVDAQLSEGQLDHLAGHLKTKLDQLRAKKRQLKTDATLDAMIYEKFHASTNGKIDQNFGIHRASLKSTLAEMEQDIQATSSLAKVKNRLQEFRPVYPWELFEME